jgi:hypothetical protein
MDALFVSDGTRAVLHFRREFFKRIFAPTERLAPTDKLALCFSWRLRAKLAPTAVLKKLASGANPTASEYTTE